jgi:transcription initiation factor TFIIIB Brf1 subunit/transcription initiation factor TFIIB
LLIRALRGLSLYFILRFSPYCGITIKRSQSNSAILPNFVIITDPETHELICKDTGEVISDNTPSPEKEWCSFDIQEDHKRGRVEAPSSLAICDTAISDHSLNIGLL